MMNVGIAHTDQALSGTTGPFATVTGTINHNRRVFVWKRGGGLVENIIGNKIDGTRQVPFGKRPGRQGIHQDEFPALPLPIAQRVGVDRFYEAFPSPADCTGAK